MSETRRTLRRNPQNDEEPAIKALYNMKKGLASGGSGVVLEILLAFGDSGTEGMTNLFNKIITKTSHQKIGIGVSL